MIWGGKLAVEFDSISSRKKSVEANLIQKLFEKRKI